MTQIALSGTWGLAQLKPNSHQIARRNLERQGFNVFLPIFVQTMRRAGQFKTQSKPLFPGYIFVGWTTGTPPWQSVNATQGITKLVSFGTQPATVPQDVMTALQERYDETGDTNPTVPLEKGDKVHVESGPFVDFIAQVETVDPDQRVWLLLDVMGRKTRILESAKNLRPTD